MKTIRLKAGLHRDGNGEVRLYCDIPKEEFPQLVQGADEATPAIIEITLLEKKRVADDDCDMDFYD